MRKGHILLLFIFLLGYGQYQFKRISFISPGSYFGHELVCGDTDNDSLNELIFKIWDGYYSLQVWEYRPTNRYELVWMAAGEYPPPPGEILVGNFAPNDIGDIDRDGLTDLAGGNWENLSRFNKTIWSIASTQESPDSFSYPESLSWYYRCSTSNNGSSFYFTDDLDEDDRREIMKAVPSLELGHTIWENVGNNQNQVVWNCTTRVTDGFNYAFGDFDLDGRKEFITAALGSSGKVSVFENTGADSYELIYQDTVRRPNGTDVFSGNDLDGDGKPEFFVSFAQYVGSTAADIYLYMWETIGNNSYERTLLNVVRRNNFSFEGRRSHCGDLDGDGIEELVWSTQTHISVYKATGNNQFQWLWEWQDDHASDIDVAYVNINDMNNNGYNEIVFSGNGKISIFEIEAVRLIRPNGGQNFLPGDSVLIKWRKFTPPRCDSFSLSYTTDNGRTYLPILDSIPSSESTYTWIIPNTPSESCRVKVTAYGPGTQFDESDALFTITGPGIDEIASLSLAMTSKVEISPNPFESQTTIHFSIPTAQKISLKLYDITGKLIKVLSSGEKKGGVHKIHLNCKDLASGIYLLSLQAHSPKQLIERLIIVK